VVAAAAAVVVVVVVVVPQSLLLLPPPPLQLQVVVVVAVVVVVMTSSSTCSSCGGGSSSSHCCSCITSSSRINVKLNEIELVWNRFLWLRIGTKRAVLITVTNILFRNSHNLLPDWAAAGFSRGTLWSDLAVYSRFLPFLPVVV
jgi:hypothetical protein